MNNEVRKETNLEHYKKELKEIYGSRYDYPFEMAVLIKANLDENMNYGPGSGNSRYTDDILEWMAQPYEESVLDDVEKAYLSAVIKPFRNRIRFIVKIRYKLLEQEFIYISVEGNSITFPPFKLGTKYKGMEVNIKYSLEELGL